MPRMTVGNFLLDCDVVVSGQSAHSVPQSSVAEHRVRVTNRSTLPYDIEVESKLPDPLPPRALSYIAPNTDQWQAQWHCVGGSMRVEQTYPLDVHGPPASGQRLWSHQLRYRLANGAMPPHSGGFWVCRNGHPLPVNINVTVS